MAILRCKTGFVTQLDGTLRVVPAGALVESDDEVVAGREQFFETVEATVSRRTPVEQATAAPGEARTVSTAKRASRK